MNKNLKTRMNELAEDLSTAYELCSGPVGFKNGFKQCHDLMLEDIEAGKDAYNKLDDINIKLNEQIIELKRDMKKLLVALDAVIDVDRETHKRHPEYEGEWSHYSDIARQALQEFKKKYGEI